MKTSKLVLKICLIALLSIPIVLCFLPILRSQAKPGAPYVYYSLYQRTIRIIDSLFAVEKVTPDMIPAIFLELGYAFVYFGISLLSILLIIILLRKHYLIAGIIIAHFSLIYFVMNCVFHFSYLDLTLYVIYSIAAFVCFMIFEIDLLMKRKENNGKS